MEQTRRSSLVRVPARGRESGARRIGEQRLVNLLWLVVPALLAIILSGRGARLEVVARHLSAPPVALATDGVPASADGFFWEIRATASERVFRARDGRVLRVTARPGELLLWCRQVGDAVYSLAGQGPDRLGPPCLVDPPFALRRTPVGGGPTVSLRDDLPSASVFVAPAGDVFYADLGAIYRLPSEGPAERICVRPDRHVTAWGTAGETLYWIEEAMPGGRDPVGSCRVMALDPGGSEPRTIAWAPDALTDLVVSGQTIAWYHPAGRALEGVLPDGKVTVLAREINLAATPTAVGDHLYYLCERPGGKRELAFTPAGAGGYTKLARLDRSARILGAARDGVYIGEEEGARGWLSSPIRTGRLLRVPLR
jgi:hypothetical protein